MAKGTSKSSVTRQVKKSDMAMPKTAAPKMPKGESPKKLSAGAAKLAKLSGASGSAAAAAGAKIKAKTKTTPKGWGPADWHGNVYGNELAKLKKSGKK